MNIIGTRIKECRQLMGYSAEQLADHLHVSPATIYRYENGDISKMPSVHLKPIADFLCTTPAYLMGWSEEGRPALSLSEEETGLILAWRAADDRARADALSTLLNHPA